MTYQRILLKLSGEALSGADSIEEKMAPGLSAAMLQKVAQEIFSLQKNGVQVAIVVGGGNFYRGVGGAASYHIDRSTGDYMGMLATIMNGLALQDCFRKHNAPCRLFSAFSVAGVVDVFDQHIATQALEERKIVVCTGGAGVPYFTTDTTAALRAIQLQCDVVLKGTKVHGVYDQDPKQNPSAVHFKKLSYDEILEKKLRVMDHTAVVLMKENRVPTLAFSIYEANSIKKALSHEGLYTLITP